ncbi:MAG: YdcH family protein [Thermoanaerobaculia bacterium]
MPNAEALKQELIESNESFRRLHDEHRDCERRLHAIAMKTLLSQEDEAEEKRIKIHKLALKDQMERMLRELRETQVSA